MLNHKGYKEKLTFNANMLTAKQRTFIKDCLEGKKIDRSRNKTMIIKRLKRKYTPLDKIANTFIEDFDLLYKYLKNDRTVCLNPKISRCPSIKGMNKQEFIKFCEAINFPCENHFKNLLTEENTINTCPFETKENVTQECTLKELFVAKKLDEFQPNWRGGADVTFANKMKIQKYVSEHYSDIISPAASLHLTIRSIQNTIQQVREKLDVESLKGREAISQDNNIIWTHPKDFNLPVRVSHIKDNLGEKSSPAYSHSAKNIETKRKEQIEISNSKKTLDDLVPIACNNPDCDKFAMITKNDKRYFFVIMPKRYGKFVRPYCSKHCQKEHKNALQIN